MKETILEGLKAKFEGISNSVLSRIAEKLAKTATNTDDAQTAIDGVTIQQVLKSYGDSRATEATQTSVANYEKKHGLKEGKPATAAGAQEPEKNEGTPNDTPEWAKALIQQNEQLAQRIAAFEGDKVVNTRKQQLAAAMEKAPAKLRERYEKDLVRMNFESEEAYAEWLAEVKTDTEAFVAEATQKGAVFGRPMGSGGATTPEKPAPEIEARIKAREAETAAPAILGLPK